MNRVVLTLTLSVVALVSHAAAQERASGPVIPCAVASTLDFRTYTALLRTAGGASRGEWTDSSAIGASEAWAACQAGALDRSLGAQPRTRARFARFRELLYTLAADDTRLNCGELCGGRANGIVISGERVSTEEFLKSAAFLVSDPGRAGGDLVPNGGAVLAGYRRRFGERLRDWRALQHGPSSLPVNSAADVRRLTDRYEATLKSFASLVGSRPDNVTLLMWAFADRLSLYNPDGGGTPGGAASFRPSPGPRVDSPCAVSAGLDVSTYLTLLRLRNRTWTDADADRAKVTWAGCRAGLLRASLADFPRLRERIDTFRTLLVQFRARETQVMRLATTELPDGLPPSYDWKTPDDRVRIEDVLASTASLARTSFGARSFGGADAAMARLRADFRRRVADLLAGGPTAAMKRRGVTAASWRAAVGAWGQSYDRVVNLAGTAPNLATFALHLDLNEAIDAQDLLVR